MSGSFPDFRYFTVCFPNFPSDNPVKEGFGGNKKWKASSREDDCWLRLKVSLGCIRPNYQFFQTRLPSHLLALVAPSYLSFKIQEIRPAGSTSRSRAENQVQPATGRTAANARCISF